MPTDSDSMTTTPPPSERITRAVKGATVDPVSGKPLVKAAPPIPRRVLAHSMGERDEQAERQKLRIMELRQLLTRLVVDVDSRVRNLGGMLNLLRNTSQGKTQAEKSGFDLEATQKFLGRLEAALDEFAPEEKVSAPPKKAAGKKKG